MKTNYLLFILALAILCPHSMQAQIQPVDAKASPNTTKLLQYYDSLQYKGDTKRVLTGSTLSAYTNYKDFIQATYDSVGVYPAILQFNIYKHAKARKLQKNGVDIHRGSGWVVPLSYNWAKQGGLVWWLFNPSNPFTGECHRSLVPDGHNFSEVWTKGTAAYQVYHEDLRMLGHQLKQLAVYDIPVVIRFIGECDNMKKQWVNPNRNRHTWDDFKVFWRHTIDYMHNELDVHNVLWCLESVGEHTATIWQEDYIDIAGLQEQFHNDTTFLYPTPAYAVLTKKLHTKKPLMYGQWIMQTHAANLPSFDFSQATRFLKQVETQAVGVITWDGYGTPIKRSHSPIHHLQAKSYYTDDLMINRGENQSFGHFRHDEMEVEYIPTTDIDNGLYFNFNTPHNFQDWSSHNAYHATVFGHVYHNYYLGKQAYVQRTKGLRNVNEYISVYIRIRNNSLAEMLRLEWQKDNNPTWYGMDLHMRPMSVDFQDLAFDLSDSDDWDGRITKLRIILNPDNVWGSSEIDYIGFE